MAEQPPIDSDPWGPARDPEPVEVDQRGLIDKILARYANKFPVLRELLQNADDAKAKHAFIRFETEHFKEGISVDNGGSPDLKANVVRWTIHNDGEMFSTKDWNRLKTIADGNPDENKVGAFGVGFYSVFEITDEPCIKSGGKQMQFHWGGTENKQLFVSRAEKTSQWSNKWTSFELPAHTPSPLPRTPMEIGRFLASSLPFMSNLEVVTVAFDSYTLLHLCKTSGPPTHHPLLEHLEPKAHSGFMAVSGVDKRQVCIGAETYVYEGNSTTPFLASSETRMLVWSADIQVDLNATSDLGKGLTKAMKKTVPEKCRFQLVYTGNDEVQEGAEKDPNCLFERLKPNLEGVKAYVHVGHATAQTTGIAGHVAARFIPTVERELIDFENKNVKTWNEALLYVGGYLARTIYEHELSAVPPESKDHSRGLHAIQFFSFKESVPDKCVSEKTREAFFDCSRNPLPIPSSSGVLPACKVRLYDPTCAAFITKTPMLSSSVSQAAEGMIKVLKEKGVRKVDLHDLMLEFQNERAFGENEMIACLRWILDNGELTAAQSEAVEKLATVEKDRKSFLEAVRFSSGRPDDVVCLSEIRTVLVLDAEDHSLIPIHSRLPTHTLPYSISKTLPVDQLMQLFSWTKLTVIEWLDNLISLLTVSEAITGTEFANLVFNVLSNAWSTLSEEEREDVKNKLQDVACVSTQLGMRKPGESFLYDKVVATFLNVPMAQIGPTQPIPEPTRQLLEFIGVHSRVDLISLLRAAESNGEALSYFFVNYAHYKDIYEETYETDEALQSLSFVPVENFSKETKKVRPSEAYIESDSQVMGFWTITTVIRPYAVRLKLAPRPPIPQLIYALKERPPKNRRMATSYFNYLSKNHEFAQAQTEELSTLAFIPLDDSTLVTPKDCYIGRPSIHLYRQLFTFVDFGNLANAFLQECLAKREPTPDDIANALIRDPKKFLQLAGNKATYMQQLRKLSDERTKLSSETMKKLKEAPILLGCLQDTFGMSDLNIELGEEDQYAKDLLRPHEVVMVDDTRSYQLFRDVESLYYAPKDLEKFYTELGCPLFSSMVEEQYHRDGEEIPGHAHCAAVRERVLERIPLFLTMRQRGMRERYEWLKDSKGPSHFNVRVYRKVRVKRILTFGEKSVERESDISAGYWGSEESIELMLTPTSPVDYFDIACCVSKVFFRVPSNNFDILLHALFSTSIPILKRRGINVDVLERKKPTERNFDRQPHMGGLGFQYNSYYDQPYMNGGFLSDNNYSPFQSKGSSWSKLPFLGSGHSWIAHDDEHPATWNDIDEELKKVITGAPGTQIPSDSSTAVGLRKEKANRHCSGSSYKGQIRKHGGHLGYEIWMSKGTHDSDTVFAKKLSAIESFIKDILEPLREVYGFQKDTVRILHDPGCSKLSAFNRNGAIYLNLDKFERDHFSLGVIREKPTGLLAFYFILAHEFTHDIEPTHNAKFELIFSRVCQSYLFLLFRLHSLREVVMKERGMSLKQHVNVQICC